LGPWRSPEANRFARSWPKASEGGLISDRWICFDVGETLIDETRVWSTWADLLGIPRFTFMAAFGAVIANDQDHRDVFGVFGFQDWQSLQPEFESRFGGFRSEDLYPDVLPALGELREAGYRIAVLANQPAERAAELRAIGIRADVMAMSDELGVHKPSPAFFDRALELMAAEPSQVAYVGDRLDNDVRPSSAAGMRAVWLMRGPWARLTRDSPPPGIRAFGTLNELAENVRYIWE
jgi:HAD superfamily hydrolase (TIGR01662 family)